MVDIAPYYRIRGKSLFPDGSATIEADSEEEEGQGSPMNKGLRGLVSRRESLDPDAPSETALKAMQQQVEKKKRYEERVKERQAKQKVLDPKVQVQILQESIKQKLAKGVKEMLLRKQSGLLKPEPTDAEKK